VETSVYFTQKHNLVDPGGRRPHAVIIKSFNHSATVVRDLISTKPDTRHQ